MTQTGHAAGSQIGKYLVKRELARGGMGAIYLAEQTALGREVAIKELIPTAVADPNALTRFMQEAQAMARTSHPNIVQVHDLEQVGTASYLVLEYVKGRSLREWINSGRLALPQAFAVMKGLLDALDYAHRHNIVHRDVKPENVLLSDEGEVKVADFGIARLVDDPTSSPATKAGTTLGTPQYMSPEQVSSSKVDGRSDLYSAGIVLYELVCGRPPFTANPGDGPFTLLAKHVQAPPPPPTLHRPGLDHDLEGVILKALAKRPEDRYQTGIEFEQALAEVADRLTPGWERSLLPGAGADPPTVPAPAASPLLTPAAERASGGPPRKPVSPVVVGVVGLVVIGLLGSIAYIAVGSLATPQPTPSPQPAESPSPTGSCDFLEPGNPVAPGLGTASCAVIGPAIVQLSFAGSSLPDGAVVQALQPDGRPAAPPPAVQVAAGAVRLTSPVKGYELAIGSATVVSADAIVVADFTPASAGDADFGLAVRCSASQCLKVAVSPKGRYAMGDYTIDGKPIGTPLIGEASVQPGQASRLVVLLEGATVEAWLDGKLLAQVTASNAGAAAPIAFVDIDQDAAPATVSLSSLAAYEVMAASP